MVYATLVDGVGGFTGRHLLEECLKAGECVVATDISKNAFYNLIDSDRKRVFLEALNQEKLLFWTSDLTDWESLENLFAVAGRRGFEVKEAYHSAAIFDMRAGREQLQAVNVEGTRNFCEEAADHGVEKVVNVGTASIYGHHHESKLIKEKTGFEDTGDYPETKYLGELVHADFNKRGYLRSVTARPGLMYGPGSVYGAIVLFSAVAQLGIIPTVGSLGKVGEARSTYLHVNNYVAAMRHLMKTDELFDRNTDDPNELAYNVADRYPTLGMTQEEIMVLVHEHVYGRGLLQEISRTIQAKFPKPKWLVEPVAKVNDWATDKIGFPALLEPNSLEYFFSDHCFDTSKLRATGFRWPIEQTSEGLRRTLDWYQNNNWPGLPDLSVKGLANGILKKVLSRS